MVDSSRLASEAGPEDVSAEVVFPRGGLLDALASPPEVQAVEPTVCVEIEFGRTVLGSVERLPIRPGRVIPLQQAGEEPVEVFVDGQLAGRGEILLREGRFCVRLTEVTTHRPVSESDADRD